jgi:phosphoribosylformylglycinamidine (FGAM) synthase-like amidotransferase family enzyme
MTKPTVHIVGEANPALARLFLQRGYRGCPSIADTDILVFTGGPDIDPDYYGEKPINGGAHNINKSRDAFEVEVFSEAAAYGKFQVGICRGAQLLNVLNGGSLWQHVDKHTRPHEALDGFKNQRVWVTSTHHQQMRVNKKDPPEILLWANHSTEKKGMSKYVNKEMMPNVPQEEAIDLEAVWYANTSCFCFQPHPEYKSYPGKLTNCTDWFFEKLDELYLRHVVNHSSGTPF